MSRDTAYERDLAGRDEDARRRQRLAEDDQRRAATASADAQRKDALRADELRRADAQARELAAKQAPAQAAANAHLVRSVALVGVGLAVAAGVTKGMTAVAARLQAQGLPEGATLGAVKRRLLTSPAPTPFGAR